MYDSDYYIGDETAAQPLAPPPTMASARAAMQVPRASSRPGWMACAFAELTALAALALAAAAFVMVLVFNAHGLSKINDADAALKQLGACCVNTTTTQAGLAQQLALVIAVNGVQTTALGNINTTIFDIQTTNNNQFVLIQLFNDTLQFDLETVASQLVMQATQIYDLQQQVAALEATVGACCP
jgi:hypothetical protein